MNLLRLVKQFMFSRREIARLKAENAYLTERGNRYLEEIQK